MSKTYLSEGRPKVIVSSDGLRVGEESYPLNELDVVVPSRYFNWEGVAVYIGFGLAIVAFSSSWITLIGLGLLAYGVYDIWLPRYKLLILTLDGSKKVGGYTGKGAKEFAQAVSAAVSAAKAEAEAEAKAEAEANTSP